MPKALWLLLIGMVINTTGSSFLWPLNTIYIHDILGHSLSFAGFILMLNSGAGIIGNLFGGVLFDRVGGYRSIIIGLIVTTVSGVILAFYHTTLPYSILMIALGFGSGMVFPSMFAMAGSVWPEGGRKPFNAIYVAQNLGVALGTFLGGMVASISFSLIFAVNGFLFICFTVFAFLTYKNLLPKNVIKNVQTSILEQSSKIKQKGPFTALVILCTGFILCWIAYVQWQTTIASYTQSLHIPVSHYSMLWTVNGLLIVLGQPLVSFVTKRMPSSKAQILLGIGIFTCSFILLTSAVSFMGLMVCMIILTMGEMLVWPAVPTVANQLAPQGRAGFYQGFVNSAATCGRMIGPLFGGIIVDVFNMHILFIILILLFVGAVFTSIIYDRPLQRQAKAQVKVS
jgi:MFS family permease